MNSMSSPTPDRYVPIDARLKISALWVSMLFVFAYVDIFSLYRPGILDEIRGGTINKFDINQTFLFLTTLYVVVPSLMVPLTLMMRPRLNRNANIVVAAIYALTVIGNAIGEWTYYIFGSAVEVLVLVGVICFARTLVVDNHTIEDASGTLRGGQRD